MNRIRKAFANEVERLLPVLHETYRRVAAFQRRRTARNARRLLKQLDAAAPMLAFFRPYVQPAKQAYFVALADASLDVSDRIVALDVAVGSMHIAFAVERAYMHRESARLREVLAACRRDDGDDPGTAQDRPGALVQGIPASPGVGTGRAFVARRSGDVTRVPDGAVLVARMTRPELVHRMTSVAGIVTDEGGALCHAAIIARELGVPCVVGTRVATQRIATGWPIRVDGSTGEVTRLGRPSAPKRRDTRTRSTC